MLYNVASAWLRHSSRSSVFSRKTALEPHMRRSSYTFSGTLRILMYIYTRASQGMQLSICTYTFPENGVSNLYLEASLLLSKRLELRKGTYTDYVMHPSATRTVTDVIALRETSRWARFTFHRRQACVLKASPCAAARGYRWPLYI